MIGLKKIKIKTSKRHSEYHYNISCAYRLQWYIGYNNGNWKIKPSNSAQKISLTTIAKQASARNFWVFLSTNALFRRLSKEGRKISKLERKMLENYSTPHGIKYFVYLSWVSPCWEQMRLAIGAQTVYIACNDTSVIVISIWKSKTHATTDTYFTYKTLNNSVAHQFQVILLSCASVAGRCS